MGELISKKQAAIAFIDGEDVEFLDKTGQWRTMLDNTILKVFLDHTEFRLKPRTISINGIEVPAPFEPKGGEDYFFIANGRKGYNSTYECDPICCFYGTWRTEEEIKQVVEALRSIFNPR